MKSTIRDIGLALNIVPDPQKINTFHKLGTQYNFLNLINDIYEKPMDNIINNDKRHKSKLGTIKISLLLKLISFMQSQSKPQ